MTRTPPAMDIGPMVSPQIMAANTGLRIGSMPEVNAAVTGETASSPRDRQMVARTGLYSAKKYNHQPYGWCMEGFVHSSRKADDEGQNIADDKGRFEIAAFHFLHLKHNGIGQAGDNGKKIAEHAAGGDLIKEKAYNTD